MALFVPPGTILNAADRFVLVAQAKAGLVRSLNNLLRGRRLLLTRQGSAEEGADEVALMLII